MSTLTARRGLLILAIASALLVGSFAVVGSASASTLYSCVKKNGNAHVFSKKPKCKKGETKLSWSTTGPAGKNGANGSNGANGGGGTNGVNGQPQKMIQFKASEANAGTPVPVPLFTADGISYTFSCQNVIFLDEGLIQASGAAAQSFGLGDFGRPTGIETKENDLKSQVAVQTIGSTVKTIASTPSAASSESSIEQYGVWTVTIEGPTSTTWIHAWFDTNPTCNVRGTAITVPN